MLLAELRALIQAADALKLKSLPLVAVKEIAYRGQNEPAAVVRLHERRTQ
jgi:hypothetical protein